MLCSCCSHKSSDDEKPPRTIAFLRVPPLFLAFLGDLGVLAQVKVPGNLATDWNARCLQYGLDNSSKAFLALLEGSPVCGGIPPVSEWAPEPRQWFVASLLVHCAANYDDVEDHEFNGFGPFRRSLGDLVKLLDKHSLAVPTSMLADFLAEKGRAKSLWHYAVMMFSHVRDVMGFVVDHRNKHCVKVTMVQLENLLGRQVRMVEVFFTQGYCCFFHLGRRSRGHSADCLTQVVHLAHFDMTRRGRYPAKGSASRQQFWIESGRSSFVHLFVRHALAFVKENHRNPEYGRHCECLLAYSKDIFR